jgi:branched-chain amino acid transport system substrate-binding protein
MAKQIIRYVLIALITALATAVLGAALFLFWQKSLPQPGPTTDKTTGYLYIGLVIPRSGPLTQVGDMVLRGAEMAVDQANQALEPGGRPYKLIIEDESADIPVKNRLANDPRVSIIVGHVTEISLEAALPGYKESGRPVILPVITDSDVTSLDQGNLFRLVPSDEAQARALAVHAREDLKAGTALVIHEDSDYGRKQSGVFAKAAAENGGLKVEEVVCPDDPEELLILAEKVAGQKPDVVFLALHARPAIYVAQAMAKSGGQFTLLGTQALALDDTVAALSRLTDRAYVTLPLDPDRLSDKAQALTKEFEARHHSFPNWLTFLGYDAVSLAAAALHRAGEKPERLRIYLEQINSWDRPFKGVAGDYFFAPHGQGMGPVKVVRVQLSLLGKVP